MKKPESFKKIRKKLKRFKNSFKIVFGVNTEELDVMSETLA